MNDDALKWRILGERLLLRTRVFDVTGRREEAAEGGIGGEYISLKSPDCVVIMPEYEGDFVLVRQWRHGAGRLTTEFPGGVIDRGEDPETAARRELLEETGFAAGKMTLLGSCSPNPALFSARFYCFLAEELTPTGQQHLDSDELVEVLRMPVGEVVASCGSEDFCHAFMGTALAFYMRHRGYAPPDGSPREKYGE